MTGTVADTVRDTVRDTVSGIKPFASGRGICTMEKKGFENIEYTSGTLVGRLSNICRPLTPGEPQENPRRTPGKPQENPTV